VLLLPSPLPLLLTPPLLLLLSTTAASNSEMLPASLRDVGQEGRPCKMLASVHSEEVVSQV
jgi:hypothetical protein